jgi:DNA primase
MRGPSARRPISREFVDEIKRRHPIAEVAALFTRLARAGTHLVGLCPLHAETIPSFYIFRETRSWYCYGCQRGGDVIDLVRHRLDLPFDEALRWLDQRPEIAPLPGAASAASAYGGVDPARALAARWSAAGQGALATALSVYTQALWETPAAHCYLVRRGITQEVTVRCHLGYCSGDRLIEALRQRGIPLQIAWEVGLLVGTARSPRERFAGRIVIPEMRGGAIAWMTGRLVEVEEVLLPAGPKYMSLPGARVLGGATSLAGRTAVLVVEGAFDWLTLVKWDLPGCYLGGGGLPEEATRMLDAARTVYVAFDQDAAGQRMAQVLARHLADRARFVDLPAGVKDVADLARCNDGLDRFRCCVREATRHPPALATS